MNTQKSVAFLCTNDELAKREIRKTIPFTTASKQIKYLGINVTRKVKDLYSENHKTLLREIKADTNIWKYIPWSWIELILSKWPSCLQQCIDSVQSLSKYQHHSSVN